jgi:hypothetical protein
MSRNLDNIFHNIPRQDREKLKKYYVGYTNTLSSSIIHACFDTVADRNGNTREALSMALIEIAEVYDELVDRCVEVAENKFETINMIDKDKE